MQRGSWAARNQSRPRQGIRAKFHQRQSVESSFVMSSLSPLQNNSCALREALYSLQRSFQFIRRYQTEYLFEQIWIKNRVLFLDARSRPSQSQTDTPRVLLISLSCDVSIAHQSRHGNAHRGTAYAHVLRQLRKNHRACCVQVIENACLVCCDGIPSLIVAYMLTMASEIDCRIGIQETSGLRVHCVHHRREGGTHGLICQTKFRDFCTSPHGLDKNNLV